MKNKKLFIFDVDGVLLDLWTVMRHAYAEFHKIDISEDEWNNIVEDFLHDPKPYIEFGNYFDHSIWFGKLPPLDYKMAHFPINLKASGFDIAIVTSTNDNEEIIEARKQNLWTIYGDIFKEIVFVGRAQSKENALKRLSKDYDTVYFCDDSIKNLVKAKEIVTYPMWYENKHHLFMLEEFDVKGIHSFSEVSEIEDFIKQTSGSFRKIIG